MSPPWKARTYQSGDEIRINDLFMRVFGIRRSLDEWKWKFREGPLGDHSIIRLACEAGRVVGQYTVVFSRFLCGGKEVLAAQPVDNMIDPDWRRGLGKSRMQRALLRDTEQDPTMAMAAMAYGFPNRQAYRIGKKILGYEDLGHIEMRLASLTWERHIRRLLGNGVISRTAGRVHGRMHRYWIRFRTQGLPKTTTSRIFDFDDRFDRLWARASASFGVIAVRDRSYLQWRYCRKPSGSYTILALDQAEDLVGYAVLTVGGDGVRLGRVADILSLQDDGIAERLVQSVLEHFLKEGCDMAECWSVPGGYYHDLLRRYFPRVHPEPVHAVIRLYDKTLAPSPVFDLSQWHLTLGDADGI